ncbi:hypothetical protein JCM10908_000043 [Rhodotorula pacifica]|uniref:zinc finger MYND domain-containing protein n=1 Tax=Rhodotorula pacifica TaxID=1495444 RepID=UPI003177D18C
MTTTPSTCFVCGAETTQRCSACAKAGVSVTFCSMEHQKLVWHTHKLVCGPSKAMPFTAPDTMSKDELATLVSLLSYAYPSGPSPFLPYPTFRHELAKELRLREDEMTFEKLEQLFAQSEHADRVRMLDQARTMMLVTICQASADNRLAPKLPPLCFVNFIVKLPTRCTSYASPRKQAELAHAALIFAAAALQPADKQTAQGLRAPTDQQLLLRLEAFARELCADQTFPSQTVGFSTVITLLRVFLNMRPDQSDFDVRAFWDPVARKMVDVRIVSLAAGASGEGSSDASVGNERASVPVRVAQ